MNPLNEYLVRASLEFRIYIDHLNGGQSPAIPHNLPVHMGPFELNRSPNAEYHLAELGFVDPEELGGGHPDWVYPVSLLYVEARVSVPDSIDAQAEADSRFESLEWLLRMFQPGDVSVRRHNWMWHEGVDGPKLAFFFSFRPVKARTAALYERRSYPLNDNDLANLAEFFNTHWDALGSVSSNLKAALSRFNSSYERRELADRLVDLVIALEALFGDREPGSIRYKIATRCASWLHPLGKHRFKAFRKIKELNDLRSQAVHGGNKAPFNERQVDELEEIVRKCLLKFLDWQVNKGHAPEGPKIDEAIMKGSI